MGRVVVGEKGGWEAALMSNVLWFGRLPVRRGEQESHRFLVPLHVSLGFEGRLFDTDDKRVSSLRNKVSNALPAVRDGVGWGLDQINLVAFARFVVGGDLGLEYLGGVSGEYERVVRLHQRLETHSKVAVHVPPLLVVVFRQADSLL